MFSIAITGGIGSGKTTVSLYLARTYKLAYINSDTLVRHFQKKNSATCRKIIKSFGRTICYKDGRLKRRKLAGLIFGDPSARRRLNRIVHPEVIRSIKEGLKRPRFKQMPAVIVEVPLLFETHLEKLFDLTVVVSVPRSIQIARVQKKFHVSRIEALQRIKAQVGPAEKIKKADLVIRNFTNKKTLERKADKLWEKIRTRLG